MSSDQAKGAAPAAIKRFYRDVTLGPSANGFEILLDGRTAKTKKRRPLYVHSNALGDAIAEEWRQQKEIVSFSQMPLTRMQMTALDHGVTDGPAWGATVLSFLQSDLLCYRADAPAALVDRQSALWDPFLAWMAQRHQVRLNVTTGVMAVDQPPEATSAVAHVLSLLSPARVLGIRIATEASGSSVLGLAANAGEFSSEELFKASRVDEDFQIERWGRDQEADARADRVKTDLDAAVRFLSLQSE